MNPLTWFRQWREKRERLAHVAKVLFRRSRNARREAAKDKLRALRARMRMAA